MRMTHLSRAAFVGLVLTFSGCGEDPLAAPGDAPHAAEAAVVPADQGVLHSVTGSGQVFLALG